MSAGHFSVNFPRAAHRDIECTECLGSGENECGGEGICCLCHGATVIRVYDTGYVTSSTQPTYTVTEGGRTIFTDSVDADSAVTYWGPDAVIVDEDA